KMLRRFITLILPLVLCQTTLAWAGAFEDGLAAYQADDLDKAWWIWLPLAEKGDPVVQNNLGSIAERRGSAQDLVETARWYGKAAAGGYAIAQHNLAVLY